MGDLILSNIIFYIIYSFFFFINFQDLKYTTSEHSVKLNALLRGSLQNKGSSLFLSSVKNNFLLHKVLEVMMWIFGFSYY